MDNETSASQEIAQLEKELETVMANFSAETERLRQELNSTFANADKALNAFMLELEKVEKLSP